MALNKMVMGEEIVKLTCEEMAVARIGAVRRGEMDTVKVVAAGYVGDEPSYGTLKDLGYMSKQYINNSFGYGDHDIVWTLTEKAEGLKFESGSAGIFEYPHTETWEK